MNSEMPPPADFSTLTAHGHMEDMWLRFCALQLSKMDPQLHPNAFELHSRMCFLAGATGMAFRFDQLLAEGYGTMIPLIIVDCHRCQWELHGLMAGLRSGEEDKAKGH